MSRKPQSRAEKEFKKQLKRIKSFITAAEKRGYTFKASAYPTIPSHITIASVRKLTKLTPQELYKKATFLTEDGQVVSGTEGRTYEYKQARKKHASRPRKAKAPNAKKDAPKRKPPVFSDVVLSNVEEMLARFPEGMGPGTLEYQYKMHERHKNIVENVLRGQILMRGRNAVAMALEARASEIQTLLEAMLYGDSEEARFQVDIAYFASIVKGTALTVEESISIQNYVDENGLE